MKFGAALGTPEEVCRRVAAIRQAGVDHPAGLVFPGHTVEQVLAPNRESRRLVLSVTQWP
jgi:hypothetical protein